MAVHMICKNVEFIPFFSDKLFYILMLHACLWKAQHSWIQKIKILIALENCLVLSFCLSSDFIC